MTRLPTTLCAGAAGLLALGLLAVVASSDAPSTRRAPGSFEHVRVVDLPGTIEPVLRAYLRRQLQAAYEEGVDCVVLRIEGPGGYVHTALEMGEILLDPPGDMHLIAWVPKEAYSAAAMIAFACDEIVMTRSAQLGAAQPGTISAEGWAVAGEKIESVLRARVRAWAEANGHPALLGEAMVSEHLEVVAARDPDGRLHLVRGDLLREASRETEIVPGTAAGDLVRVGSPVVAAGELLTLTGEEARRYGLIERSFEGGLAFPRDEAALLQALLAPEGRTSEVALSFSEEAGRFLLGWSGLLSAVVMLSLVLLIWQGPGTFTIVGGVALALLLMIHATAEHLHGFPILLVIVGVLLLAAEVFLIPGFGVAGVLGILTVAAGFLFLATGVTWEGAGGLESGAALDFALQFVLVAAAGLFAIFLLGRFLPLVGPGRRLMLAAPGAPAQRMGRLGRVPAPGERGVAQTALRPAGRAAFGDHLADVVAEGEFVDAGAPVVVREVEGNRVVVRSLAPEETAG